MAKNRLYAIRYRNDIQTKKFGTEEHPKWDLVNTDLYSHSIVVSQGPAYNQIIRAADVQGWGLEGIIAKEFFLQVGRFTHYFKFAMIQRHEAKELREWLEQH